jgi:hypothetical protein
MAYFTNCAPITGKDRSYTALAVALSQVRRTDGRSRTIHRGTTPTSFSTAPGPRRMKSLAHTPHCRDASECLAEVCLCSTQTSSSPPRLTSAIDSSLHRCARSSSTGLDPPNFYVPRSLHSICILTPMMSGTGFQKLYHGLQDFPRKLLV